jgi:hypothetical protein
MKVYLMEKLKFEEGEVLWTRKNGATRRTLSLINKSNIKGEHQVIEGVSLGYLDKGNHSFIFINNEKNPNNKIVGIALCSDYGYRVVKGTELYTSSSVGGYGNSESRFGIYEVGTILAYDTYKSRRGELYYKLTPEGWIFLGYDTPIEEDGDVITDIT